MTTDDIELPVSIGRVARRELALHGITRLAQLTEVTEQELLAIHGVGPKAVRILRDTLAANGMGFRND